MQMHHCQDKQIQPFCVFLEKNYGWSSPSHAVALWKACGAPDAVLAEAQVEDKAMGPLAAAFCELKLQMPTALDIMPSGVLAETHNKFLSASIEDKVSDHVAFTIIRGLC